ncbi:MAG: sigma 54-interacting transcriptional regulator [Polyangiales bacterium]
MAPAIGVTVGGRWRLVSPLGSGAQGSVWRATDLRGGPDVALKLLPDALPRAEIEALTALDHPRLPRLVDAGPLERGAWVAMTLVQGAALSADAPREVVTRAVASVADALAALHAAGLRHGDVKPANVILTDDGAVLVDLGLSASLGEVSGAVGGTPAFAAPEALGGDPSAASDLWSLGVTAAVALTGEHPFVDRPDDLDAVLRAAAFGASLRPATREALDPSLLREVEALLQSDPGRRPSAAAWAARWRLAASLPAIDAVEVATVTSCVPRVGRDEALASAVASLERCLDGHGAGVALVGAPGSGRRRLAEEVTRALRLRLLAKGEVLSVDGGDGAGPRLRVMLDASPEALAEAAAMVDARRRFADAGPEAILATTTGAPRAAGVDAVNVGPLDRGETRELLSVLHGAPVPTQAAELWLDIAAGLPGRLVSMARALGPAAIATATRDAVLAAATGLHRPLDLAALDDDARDLVLTLGLLREPVPMVAVDETLGARARSAVEQLEALGVITARADRCWATSAVSSDDVDPDVARAALRRFAPALRRWTADPHPLRARLSRLTGDPSAWSEYLACAADPTLPRASAAALLEEAWSVAPDPLRYASAVAQARLSSGRPEAALEALDGIDDAPSTRLLRVDITRRLGRRDEARAMAAKLAKDPDPEARAGGALVLARDLLDQGEPAAALAAATAALDGGGAASLRVRAREVAALASLSLGEVAAAEGFAREGAAWALDAGDGVARSRLAAVLGMAAQRRGAHDEARARYHEAWTLAAREGDLHLAATQRANLGAAALEAGALGEALSAFRDASRDLATLRRWPELARALANLASLLVWAGDREGGARAASRAVDAAERADDPVTRAFSEAVRAEATLEGAALAESLESCAAALSRAGDGARAEEARARAAAAWVVAGDAARAKPLAAGAGALSALARLAVAASTRGEASTALADAERAVAEDPSVEHAVALAGLRVAAARARGDAAGAATALSAWRSRVESLAATLPEGLGALFVARHGPEAEAPAVASDGSARRWRRLAEVTRDLNREPRLGALLARVLDAVLELTGAQRGMVLLRGKDGALTVRTGRRPDASDLAGDELTFSRSVAERVAETGEALLSVDASHDQRLDGSASVAAMRLRSVLAVPLRAGEQTVGTLYVDDRLRAGAFGDDAVELVRVFADAAAVAIENARTRRSLRRALARAEGLAAELERTVAAQRAELEAARESRGPDATRGRYDDIVGRGAAMRALLALVDRVAPTAMTVLLQGESGTGKELVARAIHANSPRAHRPFVAENCGAIPETLLESVLFGHVKGAFTGADRARPGLFEVADGGTLFLDEVGEMSPGMQARLLRALQEGEVRPVGGDRTRKVDVRVVAATHRDLGEMVRRGAFREDLYYRLAVVTLPVPALRERREDVPALVAHALDQLAPGVGVDRRALSRLVAAPWPGNVRQLRNEVHRAAVLSDGTIREEHLSPELLRGELRPEGAASPLDLRHAVADVERDLVERALAEHEGNQSRAARSLGLSRYGLQKKLKRLGISAREVGERVRGRRGP